MIASANQGQRSKQCLPHTATSSNITSVARMCDIKTISGLQPCCSVTTADCIPWAFPKVLLISLQLNFSPRNTRFSNRNTLYILELE